MTLTLEQLHKDLDVKQGLKNYVRNTNSKYGTNYEATQELDRETYMLIKYNTLGKLKRHGQQMKFIQAFTGMEENVDYLTNELEGAKTRADKAIAIIAKDNLKDAYIETLEVQAEFYNQFGVSEEVVSFLEKNGVRYAKYMIEEGITSFFKDRIEWFEKELAK
ncbi:hypothetical protein [Lactococcus phage PLG-II]|nr:hypothetical protein [Lactococcus phage PLG-II]